VAVHVHGDLVRPEVVVLAQVALSCYPVVAARQGDIAGDFLGVTDDRQAPSCSPCQFSLGDRCLPVNWRPKCQQTQSVLDVGAVDTLFSG
jgi:hypothetical protein